MKLKFIMLLLNWLRIERLLPCRTASSNLMLNWGSLILIWLRVRLLSRIFSWQRHFASLWTGCLHHKIVMLSRGRRLSIVFSALRVDRLNPLNYVFIWLSWFSLTHDLEVMLRGCERWSWRTTDILLVALAWRYGLSPSPQNWGDVFLHLYGVLLVNVVILLLLRVVFLKKI